MKDKCMDSCIGKKLILPITLKIRVNEYVRKEARRGLL
jgi:hypothetical protein